MSQPYNKILQASLLIALSAILYGFLGYLGTEALEDKLSISSMLFWRFFTASLWMLIFVGKNQVFKNPVKINSRVLGFVFFLGSLAYAGASGFYFMASQYIGTGLAMVIFFSYPILIALTSWLIQRKKLSLWTVLTLLVMLAGLIFLRDSSTVVLNLDGLFFALCAALSYAFYVLSSKRFSSITMDSNLLTMTVCAGSSFIFLGIALAEQQFSFPHTISAWIYLLALGILATALPIQLMLEGLKYVSSMRASIISVLEPLVTLMLGVLMLHESVSRLQFIGGFMILSAVLLVQFQKEL